MTRNFSIKTQAARPRVRMIGGAFTIPSLTPQLFALLCNTFTFPPSPVTIYLSLRTPTLPPQVSSSHTQIQRQKQDGASHNPIPPPHPHHRPRASPIRRAIPRQPHLGRPNHAPPRRKTTRQVHFARNCVRPTRLAADVAGLGEWQEPTVRLGQCAGEVAGRIEDNIGKEDDGRWEAEDE
jgi:hypothetical protein